MIADPPPPAKPECAAPPDFAPNFAPNFVIEAAPEPN